MLGLWMGLTLFVGAAKAQSADFQKMTPDERKAYFDRLRVVSQEDWQKTMKVLNLSEPSLPAPDVSLIEGDLAFRNYEGGRVDSLDWPVFLKFANGQFQALSALDKK